MSSSLSLNSGEKDGGISRKGEEEGLRRRPERRARARDQRARAGLALGEIWGLVSPAAGSGVWSGWGRQDGGGEGFGRRIGGDGVESVDDGRIFC